MVHSHHIANAPSLRTCGQDTPSLVIGTRGSALALHQANYVAGRIGAAFPAHEIRVAVISSEGDVDKESPLTRIGGRGVFTSSLQRALTLGEVDLAVHSSKDLPSISAAGLAIAAFPQREDPRDVVVSRHNVPLAELPAKPVIGTSSRRRAVQVLAIRPDAQIVDLRGNIDTRLRKASTGPYDAVILAAAGLTRMGWIDRATEILPVDRFTPAPGQGALAIETRETPDMAYGIVATLDDARIRQALEVERAFLRGIGGGCTTPLGAHATIETLHGQPVVRFHAMVARDDGEGLTRIYEEWPVALAAEAAFEAAMALVREVHPNRVFGASREQASQLHGMRVLVTGTDELATELREEIVRRGGEPVLVPTIRIEPPEDQRPLREALDELRAGAFDHLVLTSRQGVGSIADTLVELPRAAVKIAAIGQATASALRQLGIEPAIVA
ncbi:MAG TPA: hydroxymethylbilane synthase, partial [Thermomicrobiales bacterium]|nr:hydroxymethylbilane synthase [Thermomicrobiales bacterium]